MFQRMYMHPLHISTHASGRSLLDVPQRVEFLKDLAVLGAPVSLLIDFQPTVVDECRLLAAFLTQHVDQL